ncbi:MAG TPA: helix-turn-helix domain-containing protein [Gammaproteobacteria bacterium]|nr:helix-turn-helix domain-containing protein [Gammaproteobacteria bacterium]
MERFNPYRAFAGCVLPSWLLRARDVSMGAKLAYARLAQYAGETGVAWPTVATLGAELGVSERQARSYLAELRGHRLIEQEDDPQHRSSSKFFFLRHPWMETNPDRGAGSCPPEGKNPSGQGGRILPPKRIREENQGRESLLLTTLLRARARTRRRGVGTSRTRRR